MTACLTLADDFPMRYCLFERGSRGRKLPTGVMLHTASMAQDPPALPTTLLQAQLIVAKAAASKKQQKKDNTKASKKASMPAKSKVASKGKWDKENQDVKLRAEKGNRKTICIL